MRWHAPASPPRTGGRLTRVAGGARNTGWFLAFLLGTVALCLYCSLLSLRVLAAYMADGLQPPPWARGQNVHSLPFGTRALLAFSQRVPVACLGLFTLVVALVLLTFAGYHFWLALSNVTTYEEFKWSRYHRTGRRAVRFVAQKRKNANLPHQSTLADTRECRKVARDTIEAFGLHGADDSSDSGEEAAAKGATSGTAGESRVRKRVVAASTSALASAASVEEGVLNDDDRERLQRAVAILQKYDPEAHNLYGQTRTWRENLIDAYSGSFPWLARWNRKAR